MKTLVQLVMVALIFGGLSAAGTIFMQPRTTPTVAAASGDPVKSPSNPASDNPNSPLAEQADSDASHEHHVDPSVDKVTSPFDENALAAAEPPRGPQPVPPKPGDATIPGTPAADAGDNRPEARVAVRPPYTPEGDEAGGLINLLRDRSRIATETERRLAERQDAMQLIFEDLRAEQTRTIKIRQRMSNELTESRQAVDAALQALENERTTIHKDQADTRKAAEDALHAAKAERDKLRQQLEKATAAPTTGDGAASSDLGGSPEDNVNLKKMAAVFDSMPAEDVARVFEQLVKNKRIPSVVSLMNSMKDRQAAKVLVVIAGTNAELAADLTDRLKRLKTSTPKPGAE